MTKVTANQLNTGGLAATVATAEATSSTSYTDLTTTTDTVTVNVGVNGLLLVTISCHPSNNATANIGYMGFALSGANTLAASDAKAFYLGSISGLTQGRGSYTVLLTGLTPGSTTVKAKYKTSANSCTFSDREISAIPL